MRTATAPPFTPGAADAPAGAGAPRPGRWLALARGFLSSGVSVSKSRGRLILLGLLFAVAFAVVAGRLVQIGLLPETTRSVRRTVDPAISTARPPVLDRHGAIVATDLKALSIFANPREITDKDEAAELLNAVFPELDGRQLRQRLSSRRGFIWIKREVSPATWAQVHRLGIPGLGVVPENRRVYPNGPIGSHVVGYADIDNTGLSGIERWMDGQGLNDLKGAGFGSLAADLAPVSLALDLRVTHAMRDELAKGKLRYRAKAAAGALLDVETGEIVAHASLPDFDPNNPVATGAHEHKNMLQSGTYEMGSTFKALTVAMALDSGRFSLNSSVDARQALRYGRFRINDFRGKGRVLTIPEVFVYSSNIGTARLALALGVEHHRAFLRRMGQLDRMPTESMENPAPQVPRQWGELNTMTISFGHGLAVTPIQALAATAALVNGGRLIPPTYRKRTPEEAAAIARQVIKHETSEAMRYLMRLNAERGSAQRANIPGYFVGGKTGTSEKVVDRRYSKEKVLTTFMAIFPSDRPRYILLTMFDEPQAVPETMGQRTSGWNAAPTAGLIIERIGPMLDLTPRFENPRQPFPRVARLNPWGMR